MTDRVLATLAILGVIAYLVPLIHKVPDPGLLVVLLVVIAMATYDFVRDLRSRR